jgi:site-specific recombinase XerD
MTGGKEFPTLLQAFFTDRLLTQRKASPHTVASYRDTFCLLLRFAEQRLKKAPTTLTLGDLDATLIAEFLAHLEGARHNSARTRNVRLAALHSFFRYAALHVPESCALIERVLAIPPKRFTKKPVEFLTAAEVEAILNSPDQSTWIGRRAHALLLLTVQTGLRVSELTALRRQDVHLGDGPYVRCHGKGRKERVTPLRADAVRTLRQWLHGHTGRDDDPLFPNSRGGFLSRDAVEYLLTKYVTRACQHCPSLNGKRISPHTLRHTAAMDLLQHGVDHTVIALWLGHESTHTTQIYLHADLSLKERALAKTLPHNVHLTRFRPDDKLLAALLSL